MYSINKQLCADQSRLETSCVTCCEPVTGSLLCKQVCACAGASHSSLVVDKDFIIAALQNIIALECWMQLDRPFKQKLANSAQPDSNAVPKQGETY